MNVSKRLITSLVLAGGLAIAAPALTLAEPGMGMGPGKGMSMGKQCPLAGTSHYGKQGHCGKQGHGGMMGGHDLQPRFLRGLDLTEAQQDQVFDILYPLIPAQRSHHKAARDLRQQQKALTLSPDFDAGKLKKLLDAEAKSHSEHKLKLATAHNKIYQLLTDEQKAQVAERRQKYNR